MLLTKVFQTCISGTLFTGTTPQFYAYDLFVYPQYPDFLFIHRKIGNDYVFLSFFILILYILQKINGIEYITQYSEKHRNLMEEKCSRYLITSEIKSTRYNLIKCIVSKLNKLAKIQGNGDNSHKNGVNGNNIWEHGK